MGLLIQVLIAAVVAVIVYVVATALIGHALIVGLVCLVIFLLIAFGGNHYYTTRHRGI
jgi:hypothetical protein